MRIAENIPGYGTQVASDFAHMITSLVAEETITKVIETGTYLGLGTTRAVLDGMRFHGMEFNFISIEVNPSFHKQAIANNVGVPGLHLLNGLSIGKPHLPIDTTFNVPDHVIVDHQPSVRQKLYNREIDFDVEDHLLSKAIEALSGKPELVILDSAGHMGLIEFKYLMNLLGNHSFYLALDDIGHVKHYESFEFVKSHPEVFTILWESELAHKAAIIKVN